MQSTQKWTISLYDMWSRKYNTNNDRKKREKVGEGGEGGEGGGRMGVYSKSYLISRYSWRHVDVSK